MDETTAWKEIFYLCLSLGMQTEGKTGVQSVKSFIVANAKAAQQRVQPTLGEQSELKCVFCNQPLHEYETHCLVAQSG